MRRISGSDRRQCGTWRRSDISGNDAAHPNLDNAGQIIDVSREDAEWTLDAVVAMFDELFVQPVRDHARAQAYNELHGKVKVELPALPKQVPSLPEGEQ